MKVFSSIILALCVFYVEAEAPGYPASGWKPNGRLLALPARVQEAPKPVYGPPSTFKPPTSYGPPTTVDFGPSTTVDIPNTTPAASGDESSEVEGSGDATSAQQQQEPNVESGLYYVLLADGRLQRVEYVTAPLQAFENEKQTAFAGFPGFQIQPVEGFPAPATAAPVKPLKYQNQPAQSASPYQVGAFQGNQKQGFNSAQYNQAQASGNLYKKVQVQGSNFKSAAFIQPLPAASTPAEAPATPAAPTPAYLVAPNPASVSAFATFQQYQAEKAYAAQQEAAQYTAAQSQTAQYNAAQSQTAQYNAAQSQTAQYNAAQQAPAAPGFQGFVSNVQYKDVEPITAPIYAYQGAQNFARILK